MNQMSESGEDIKLEELVVRGTATVSWPEGREPKEAPIDDKAQAGEAEKPQESE